MMGGGAGARLGEGTHEDRRALGTRAGDRPKRMANLMNDILFYTVIGLPILSFVVFVTSMNQASRKWIAVALALLSPGLYAIYESRVSPYAEIRMDLAILLPVLFLDGFLLLVYTVSILRDRFRRQ